MGYALVLLVGVCIAFLFYMYKEAFADRVLNQEITFPNFPESFEKVTIFFISDIHKRKITSRIIDDVKGKADMVVIGGDLLEKGVPIEQVKENIEKLKTVGPVYFVWGNNDYEIDFRLLDVTLQQCGVKILDNTAVSFESQKGDRFILLGVDDMNLKRDRLDLALSDAGKEGFRVLVSHNPKITVKIKPEDNISLVLSGHTHGGQIHIFGYSPYEKGRIKKVANLNTTILISNGYGTTALPLRLGAKSETHLLTIRKG